MTDPIRSLLQFRPLALALLAALAAAGCTTPAPAPQAPRELVETNRPFAAEINAFADADHENPPPKDAIVFVGSSSIRRWTTLAQDFPNHQVINRGFGGSQIIDAVNYADRIVVPYQPKHIVMYAGGNDINAGKSPEELLADFQAFVRKVRKPLPNVEISYISIAPNPARWSQVARVREANRLISTFARYDGRISFIDVFPHMLGRNKRPRPDIFVADRLHMNGKGYELWKQIVGEHLDKPRG
jgi:lysophospholipase L1-like esterase